MKILVATDGTSASEAAVEELLRLPLRRVAEINVLTVMPDKERWNEDSQLNADSFDATLPEDWGDRDTYGEDTDLAFAEELFVSSVGHHAAGKSRTGRGRLPPNPDSSGLRRSVALPRGRLFSKELLDDVAHLLRCKTGRVRRVVAVGHPAEEILHAAEKLNVNLIVMGNKGRTGIDRWVLGSVSEKVVQQAKCPVLIVKLQESRLDEVVSENEGDSILPTNKTVTLSVAKGLKRRDSSLRSE